MDNPHSPVANVHSIIVASSSSVRTPLGPIFLYLVFSFKWSEMELIGMFHAPLTLHREYVLFSTTSIINSKVSSIHMSLLVVENIRFSCVDILFYGLGVGGQFSLFVARGRLSLFVVCKSIMLFHHLWRIIKFVIALNFVILAFSNLVECVLAQSSVSFSLSCKQFKNLGSVTNMGILHVLGVLH